MARHAASLLTSLQSDFGKYRIKICDQFVQKASLVHIFAIRFVYLSKMLLIFIKIHDAIDALVIGASTREFLPRRVRSIDVDQLYTNQ